MVTQKLKLIKPKIKNVMSNNESIKIQCIVWSLSDPLRNGQHLKVKQISKLLDVPKKKNITMSNNSKQRVVSTSCCSSPVFG